MKKIPLLLTLVLALLLFACEEDGELRIRNRSTTDVNVTLDYESSLVIRPSENYSRFYNTNQDVRVSYDGLYLFSGVQNRYVELGSVNVLTLISDGGAILLVNSSNRTITNVYLSPSGDVSWGQDDLSGDIAPGASVSWTVTEGFWDIKVKNNLGQEYSVFSNQVLKDSTFTHIHEGRGERGAKTDYPEQAPGMKSEQYFAQ
jgi:hypothetical protein